MPQTYAIPRDMPTAIATFFTALNAANSAYTAAHEQVRRDYPRNGYPSYDPAAGQARTRIENARSTALNAAWTALASSDHPLAAWIARNVPEDYQSQGRETLARIRNNTTRQDLEDWAESAEYCYVWGQFRDRAIRDGAFGNPVPDPNAPIYTPPVTPPTADSPTDMPVPTPTTPDSPVPTDILPISMRVNGSPWQPFWAHVLPNGTEITRDFIAHLMANGVSFIALDTSNGDTLKYQLG